jgi:hypothetical protein
MQHVSGGQSRVCTHAAEGVDNFGGVPVSVPFVWHDMAQEGVQRVDGRMNLVVYLPELGQPAFLFVGEVDHRRITHPPPFPRCFFFSLSLLVLAPFDIRGLKFTGLRIIVFGSSRIVGLLGGRMLLRHGAGLAAELDLGCGRRFAGQVSNLILQLPDGPDLALKLFPRDHVCCGRFQL